MELISHSRTKLQSANLHFSKSETLFRLIGDIVLPYGRMMNNVVGSCSDFLVLEDMRK